jgi:hypothetical protein
VIAQQAGSLLALRKTFPMHHIRDARHATGNRTRNAPSDALKNLSQEGDHWRRNRIEVENQNTSTREERKATATAISY